MNILNKFTLKTLLKNKTRSIVTIIGIVLSLAMFTAVTTSVYSMQQFMSEAAKEKEGDWHGAFKGMSRDELAELSDNEQVDSLVFLQDIGYAKLEKGQNEYKPYIFIGGINENFDEKMPVNLISGHLPQSPTEIILPKHIATNGGVKYALGDTLNLKIGRRFFDGKIMLQNNEFVKGKAGDEAETLKLDKSRSYTVVGFYERPTFEGHSAPGYTALTLSEEDPELSSTAYYKLKNMNNINKFVEENYTYLHQELNTDFLSFSGISQYSAFKEVLYSFAGILIIIIAFGSISLIYNSFSISVSERTRQFGLLSSVGATRRQMRQSVLFEAVVLGAVGIPLGLVTGMAGMAITFRLTGSMFTAMSSGQTDKTMDLCVSWQSLAIAAVVGFITVIISAYIPARRAVKLSAIEAVKQTGDISIKAKKVKTSRLTYTLFGFEGMLASKNFKRNRKKYRATVISLFMSVVLFISAMGYCTYLTRGTENVFSKSEYDISYRVPDIKKEALDWKE
ncbi:MAG: FtsX-like permease family protein, partial [Oscillospiraceae bacterium]